MVAVGDLARKCGLGVEMLQNALQSRIGTTVHGKLDGGIVYTPSFLSRIKAQLRGALRGASTPIMLPTLRKDLLGLDGLGGVSALVPGLIEELQSEGSISGKMASGGGSWVPSAFSAAQQDAVKTFFEQNNYLMFDMATKSGIGNPSKYCIETFPAAIVLSSACVSPAVVHEMSAAIEDAVQNASWCDMRTVAPGALHNDDVIKLITECKGAMDASANAKVLASTCVVSGGFLDGLLGTLKKEANKAAQEASNARRNKAANSDGAPVAGQKKVGGGKGMPSTGADKKAEEDSDNDDDWGVGKGKGKKGKGAGGGGGKRSAAKGRKHTPPSSAAPGGSSNAAHGAESNTLFLSPDHLRQRVISLHPDVEYAGIDEELPDALVSHARPDIVAEYERVLSDIFTAGAEKRRRLREAAMSRLESAYQTLQLHVHGAELFKKGESEDDGSGDDTTSEVLLRHVMRIDGPACVDALLHVLQADVAEEDGCGGGDASSVQKTPEEMVAESFASAARAVAAKSYGGDAKEEVGALVNALSGSTTTVAQFEELLEAASTAVGLRLKKVDKKAEGAAVKERCASLLQQVGEAEDAALVLAGVVPYLIAKHRNRCVSLPGKALAPAVELLCGSLSEEEHGLLKRFYGEVVDHLKRGGGDAEESLQGMIEEVKSKLL